MVIIGEDMAIADNQRAGRRGLAGTVFVHKVAGAMAAQGLPLRKIVDAVNNMTKNMGTMGVALKPCTLPGMLPSDRLKENEMELGLGIHGEPGVRKAAKLNSKETVDIILDTIAAKDTGLGLKEGYSKYIHNLIMRIITLIIQCTLYNR